MAFGAEIKRLLKSGKISAQKFADTVGIDVARLRKWMQNDLTPKHDDAKKIEEFFGIPLSKFSELREVSLVKRPKEIFIGYNSADNESLSQLTILQKLYESEKAHNEVLQSIIDRLLKKMALPNENTERLNLDINRVGSKKIKVNKKVNKTK